MTTTDTHRQALADLRAQAADIRDRLAVFSTAAEDFKEVESVGIPQWEGLHDYLTVFERIPEGA